MRDKGLVFLIKGHDTKKMHKIQTVNMKSIINAQFLTTSCHLFKFSTCITCLPLNLCLPFTSVRLKHCPCYKYWDNQRQLVMELSTIRHMQHQLKLVTCITCCLFRLTRNIQHKKMVREKKPSSLSLVYCRGLTWNSKWDAKGPVACTCLMTLCNVQ